MDVYHPPVVEDRGEHLAERDRSDRSHDDAARDR